MICLYPEQMRRIADILEALNKIDGLDTPETEGVTLQLEQGLKVTDEYGSTYGFMGDEIGGSWCFWPGTENPYAKKETTDG